MTDLETRVPVGAVLEWAGGLVEPALRKAVAELPAPEGRIAGYHRGWHDADGCPLPPTAGTGGKAVRPALVFLSACAVGGRAADAVAGAVAVELIHDFSLLHDDVIDGDRLRRHRPAVWTVFGTPAAVLAGDALLVAALRTLSGGAAGPAGEAAAGEMLRMLGELMLGQSRDVEFAGTGQVGAEEYLAMAAGKTGALMACACAVGGILAGARPQQVDGLRDFGRHLGVAFQCVDDLIGIWGASACSGKPVGADLAARKKSLPVVAALTGDSEAGRRLAELYGRAQPLEAADIALAADLVEEAGGRVATEREAARHTDLAMRALSRAEPDAASYRQLQELAALLTRRER
ncbi:polyprenyl synthetase family protein [Streptomyces sp. NPDC052415]|uniref:polyprenyl synthetase family protein n=1 Tax=Streptomyces sp. NPDC052415 TaxID=3365690 RepID=UPI0037D93396